MKNLFILFTSNQNEKKKLAYLNFLLIIIQNNICSNNNNIKLISTLAHCMVIICLCNLVKWKTFRVFSEIIVNRRMLLNSQLSKVLTPPPMFILSLCPIYLKLLCLGRSSLILANRMSACVTLFSCHQDTCCI